MSGDLLFVKTEFNNVVLSDDCYDNGAEICTGDGDCVVTFDQDYEFDIPELFGGD